MDLKSIEWGLDQGSAASMLGFSLFRSSTLKTHFKPLEGMP